MRRVARIGASLSLVAVVLAAWTLVGEYRVAAAACVAEAQQQALLRGDVASAASVEIAAHGPARAQLYRATVFARAAQAEAAAGRRRSLLTAAATAVSAAERARPLWGEALTVDAFIRSLAVSPPDAVTLATYAASYRAAPFDHGAAPWRVGFGFAQWPRLAAPTRARLINEAVWLARVVPDARAGVFDAARLSPGYRAFTALWIAMRRGDADLAVTRERPTP